MTDTPVNDLEINEKELGVPENAPKSKLETEKAKQSIAEIETNQASVATIKALIDSIIDSIAQNQSMLSRAALFWGKLPLWQKIGAGVLLIAPSFILGIVLHLSILFVISALTLIAYIPTSYILDNHYEYDEQVTDQLKDGMTVMATSLEAVLETMNEIQSKLAHQIESFHEENERLTSSIIDLSTKINTLTQKSRELLKTEQELRTIQHDLEDTETTLRLSVQENDDLLQKNKHDLEMTSKAYDETQRELSKTIVELKEVRNRLSKEIGINQRVAEALKKTVENIAPTVIMDDEIRIEFQKKLDTFITDKEKSFNTIAQRICDATQELSLVKDELNRTERRFNELLSRQALQVERLASQPQINPPEPHAESNARKIRKFGINAHKPSSHVNENENDEQMVSQIAAQ